MTTRESYATSSAFAFFLAIVRSLRAAWRAAESLFPAAYGIWTPIEVRGEERLACMKSLTDLTDFLG
jgi:hypothetical protein